MKMPPFIEDYYNEIHDQAAAIELIKLNGEYQGRLNAIDKQQKNNIPPPRFSMENVTNTAKRIDFDGMRRLAGNEAKYKAAQISAPNIEDPERLAELLEKHAPDQDYLDSFDKSDKDLTAKQIDFQKLMKAAKERTGRETQKEQLESTTEKRSFPSMSMRYNKTLGYSEMTKETETILTKEDILEKTQAQPTMSMSQRFSQTLGYSELDDPSDPGESKETKNLDLGKDDPNDD